MRVYLMNLMDEKYSYVFKYKGHSSDLLKSLSSSSKLIRIGDYLVNKDRIKEIKDITFDETNKIEEIPEIELIKCNNLLNIDNMIIKEQCDIDEITKDLYDKIKYRVRLVELNEK